MSIRLSEASGKCLPRLQRALLMVERPAVLRLAFAFGIKHSTSMSPETQDSKGPQIPLRVLTRGEDEMWDAVVSHVLGKNSSTQGIPSEADQRRGYKMLVDHGVGILAGHLDRQPEAQDSLLMLIADYTRRPA